MDHPRRNGGGILHHDEGEKHKQTVQIKYELAISHTQAQSLENLQAQVDLESDTMWPGYDTSLPSAAEIRHREIKWCCSKEYEFRSSTEQDSEEDDNNDYNSDEDDNYYSQPTEDRELSASHQ